MRFRVLTFDNYDGDSFNLELDLGFNLRVYKKCRLYGADTCELRDKRPAYRLLAYKARDMARQWVLGADEVIFHSERYTGKYGRPLGDLILDGESLRQRMLDNRLAVEYDGGNKAALEDAHAANVMWHEGEVRGEARGVPR